MQARLSLQKALFSKWMEPCVSRGIFRLHKPCIYLCRGNITETQHLLNIGKLSAVFKQVRRKRLSKCVRCDILLNPCHIGIMLYNFPKALTGQMLTVHVGKKLVRFGIQHYCRPHIFKIIRKTSDRTLIHGDNAFLTTCIQV